MQVQRDPDLGGARLAQGPDGQAVAEQQVVGGGRRGGGVAETGCVVAVPVSVGRDDLGLVQGDPPGDPVAERIGGQGGVFTEPFGRIALRPPPLVLQFLRQVPVVEGGRGRDAVPGELVEQRPVIVQAPLVDGAPAAGLDPRPGDGEAVGGQAQGGEQGHVLGVTMIGVTGDVAGVAAADLAWRVTEGVPHRGAPAVDAPQMNPSGKPRAPSSLAASSVINLSFVTTWTRTLTGPVLRVSVSA